MRVLTGMILAALHVAVAVLVLTPARKSGNGGWPRNGFAAIRTSSAPEAEAEAEWRVGRRAAQKMYLSLIPILVAAPACSLANAFIDGPLSVYVVVVLACGLTDVAIAMASASAASAPMDRPAPRPLGRRPLLPRSAPLSP